MADILLTINSTAAPVNIGEVKLSAPIAIGDVGIRLPGPQGEPETPGQDGGDGVSIEYRWNGTELGIKREDEVNYQYANLKGEKGDQGDQGIQGPKGDKGDKGDSGYTPIRGTDYWTSADKADIVSDVLAALPDGDEVEY